MVSSESQPAIIGIGGVVAVSLSLMTPLSHSTA